MSLFFCGITMAHYNSYNLSKSSQVTAESIFKRYSQVRLVLIMTLSKMLIVCIVLD